MALDVPRASDSPVLGRLVSSLNWQKELVVAPNITSRQDNIRRQDQELFLSIVLARDLGRFPSLPTAREMAPSYVNNVGNTWHVMVMQVHPVAGMGS